MSGSDFRLQPADPDAGPLEALRSGRRTIQGETLESRYVADPNDPSDDGVRPSTDAEKEELARIGHSNWYDWSVAHWGTKRNACRTEIVSRTDGSVVIRFDTAWAAPLPAFEAMFELFPRLNCECRWQNEGEEPVYVIERITRGVRFMTTQPTIIHGDCIEAMNGMKAASEDFILTDPPYMARYKDRSGLTVPNDAHGACCFPPRGACTVSGNRMPSRSASNSGRGRMCSWRRGKRPGFASEGISCLRSATRRSRRSCNTSMNPPICWSRANRRFRRRPCRM